MHDTNAKQLLEDFQLDSQVTSHQNLYGLGENEEI